MADVLVAMNGEGRITIPAAARRQLGLEGAAQFQAEVRDGVLMVRPAVVIPREAAWAYTPDAPEEGGARPAGSGGTSALGGRSRSARAWRGMSEAGYRSLAFADEFL